MTENLADELENNAIHFSLVKRSCENKGIIVSIADLSAPTGRLISEQARPPNMPSALTLPTVPSARPGKRPEAAVVPSAEFELLLACCAHTGCHERVREVLEGPLDWDRLIQLARNHGVVPHLYRSLSSSGTAPPEALQLLQQVDESNARKAL